MQAHLFSQSLFQNEEHIVFSSEYYQIYLHTHDQKSEILRLRYHISDFSQEKIILNEDVFTKITLGKTTTTFTEGQPELPVLSNSVILPDTKNMQVSLIQAHYQEYDSIQVIPSKGNLIRTVNPDEVAYRFDTLYTKDFWYPESIVHLSEPYILRDFRGCCIQLIPFQYHPTLQKLRFYTDITLELTPCSDEPINPLFRTKSLSSCDSEFLSLYQRHFLNFNQLQYTPIPEQGKMLIITYDQFYEAMKPFVVWKNMRGIATEMINISAIGDAHALKNFIKTYYETTGVTFVLLVGDIQQLPTLYRLGGASDPSYSYVVGSDHYPDLFIGRFSAQNINQLQTQIQRTLDYEQNPQSDAPWYHQATGIASNQGPGDNGEYDNEHIDNIRTILLNYTYTMVDQIYDPTASIAQVVSALNNGRGLINYCGHGWSFGWGTTGFSKYDIYSLTNTNMLPFIFSVACNNGEFDSYDECFAEAWLRATYAGRPAGAIGAFMSSISQSWNPPMAAQDEMVNLLVESYENNKKHTFGGICFSGCMYMNDRYGGAGAQMTDTWHVFGDPSFVVRTDTPTRVSAVHADTVSMGALTFDVTVAGGHDLVCAVSKNGKLYGYGYPDETGHVEISFNAPLPPGGMMSIVVVGYNTIPYHADIPIIGEDEPPTDPDKPSGRRIGRVNVSYVFTTQASDPENHDLYYLWDFGDGDVSEWYGPYPSEATVMVIHSWASPGVYTIRVKAKDGLDVESNWSEPCTIYIPKNRTMILSFYELFKHRFPLFAEILQKMSLFFS